MTDREAFEWWYGKHAGWYPVTKAKNHPTLPDGTYLYDSPNNMWDCWQSATKAERERCAKVADPFIIEACGKTLEEIRWVDYEPS